MPASGIFSLLPVPVIPVIPDSVQSVGLVDPVDHVHRGIGSKPLKNPRYSASGVSCGNCLLTTYTLRPYQ